MDVSRRSERKHKDPPSPGLLAQRCPSVDFDDLAPSWLSINNDDSPPHTNGESFSPADLPDFSHFKSQTFSTVLRSQSHQAFQSSSLLTDTEKDVKTNESNGLKLDLSLDLNSGGKAGIERHMQHGFSLGRRSLSENFSMSAKLGEAVREIDGREDEEEDEGVGEIYIARGDLETSPLDGPDTERQVISHRIGQVGRMGQNLALGHLLGLVADDSSLRPSPLHIPVTCYVLDDASPLQTDIRWSRPSNADKFRWLSYEVELSDVSSPSAADDGYKPVTLTPHPVLRVYHTDKRLLLGRTAPIEREGCDLTLKLRVRAVGQVEVARRDLQGRSLSHKIPGDWSDDIFVTFVGWDNQGRDLQLTNL